MDNIENGPVLYPAYLQKQMEVSTTLSRRDAVIAMNGMLQRMKTGVKACLVGGLTPIWIGPEPHQEKTADQHEGHDTD